MDVYEESDDGEIVVVVVKKGERERWPERPRQRERAGDPGVREGSSPPASVTAERGDATVYGRLTFVLQVGLVQTEEI